MVLATPFSRFSQWMARLLGLVLLLVLLGVGWAVSPVRSRLIARPLAGHPATVAQKRPGLAPKTGKPLAKAPVKSGVKTMTSASAPNPNAFITFYNAGRSAYQVGNYPEAAKQLKTALSLVEKSAGARHRNTGLVAYLLGLSFYKQKQYPQAVPLLQRAMNILQTAGQSPTEMEGELQSIHSVLGEIAMKENRFPEAQMNYQAALDSLSRNPQANAEQKAFIQGVLTDIAHIDNAPTYAVSAREKVMRWRNPAQQPIRVYLDSAPQLPGWRTDDPERVREAYLAWQNAAPELFRFTFVDDPALADTVVSWMALPKPKNERPEPGGQAETDAGECQTLIVGDILSHDSIVIALNREPGKPYAPESLYNVALHEIGHSLGLGAHSSSPADIMFASTKYDDARKKSLSERDIATVRLLYSLKPEVSNPADGIPLVQYEQFTLLQREAATAFNAKNYGEAFERFKLAIARYDQSPENRFFAGLSAYHLQRYAEAMPYFAAANAPGKYQAEALKMQAVTLMVWAEQDEQAGLRQYADNKYASARQLLVGSAALPMDAETARGIREMRTWLDQRLSGGSLIQWGNGEPVATNAASPNPAVKKKSRWGWLGGFSSPANPMAIPVPLPARMMGY